MKSISFGNIMFAQSSRQQFTVGEALADKLACRNPQVRSLFQNFSDLSVIHATTAQPDGRQQYTGLQEDLQFMAELQNLIKQGVISNGTLVLSDTGHDIPLAARLGNNLSMQAVFCLPSAGLTPESQLRIRDQAVSFGDQIERAHTQSQNAVPATIFVGLEHHRLSSIPSAYLPSSDMLRSYGFQKVIYLTETSPTANLDITSQPDDIKPYLLSLQKGGLSVELYGVDSRDKREHSHLDDNPLIAYQPIRLYKP